MRRSFLEDRTVEKERGEKMLVILLFIIILNIVSIVLMYYNLGNLSKKEKLIFIAAGTAIMYILTSIVYWISTRSIEITEVSETGKDLIIFLFVPINGIIVLPLLAKSYNRNKIGSLKSNVLRNRGIVLGIVLVILLIIECSYFKNIQEQVVSLIMEQQQTNEEQENLVTNETAGNTITNTMEDIETMNQTTNEIVQGNGIQDEIVNSVTNSVTNGTSENIIQVNTENVANGSNVLE